MSSNNGPVLVTDLARARGLGASHTGTDHWWTQRLTSLALLPLSLWFIFSIASMAGASYVTVKLWLQSPCNAALLIALVLVMFHHAVSGMEVIFEDYIHCKCAKVTTIVAVKFAGALGAITCTVSVLKLALGG
ncbi:MAG: succinate dehydrogenase, hydrophobic membrane anchor protein [Rhodospirillaceae bacterium]